MICPTYHDIPIVSIIYINDLPEIVKFVKFILYTDDHDANLFVIGSTVKEVYRSIHYFSKNLLKWVYCNSLALNIKETKYMKFNRNRSFVEQELTQNSRKTYVRLLRVILDRKCMLVSSHSYHKDKNGQVLMVVYIKSYDTRAGCPVLYILHTLYMISIIIHDKYYHT